MGEMGDEILRPLLVKAYVKKRGFCSFRHAITGAELDLGCRKTSQGFGTPSHNRLTFCSHCALPGIMLRPTSFPEIRVTFYRFVQDHS